LLFFTHNPKPIAATISISLLTFSLTACGGGSSDNSATSVSTPPTPPVVSVVALEAAKTCSLPNFQQELMTLINQARASSRMCGTTSYPAVAAVSWNSKLFNAAAAHSADMATYNYFSHTSLDGRLFSQRLAAAGYTWSAIGENIAAGTGTVAQAMSGWINSPGHCANIMSGNFTEVGMACVSSSTSAYRTYWTMDLGRP
jgi:uncharacterized protein YkwD